MFSALETRGFQRRAAQLGGASDLVWVAASAAGPGLTVAAVFLVDRFQFDGQFWAYVSLSIRAGLYVWAKEGLRDRGGETIWRLFSLGLVAGALELLVDYALVHVISTGRLVYLGPAPLLASPLWMPLAWACVIVELGYPALRLFGMLKPLGTRRAAWGASLVVAVAAGLTVGLYEVLAPAVGWWKYEPARSSLWGLALYIPVGEALMFLPILPLAAAAVAEEDRPCSAAVRGGAIFALCIAAGYGLAYLVLEVI